MSVDLAHCVGAISTGGIAAAPPKKHLPKSACASSPMAASRPA